MNVFLCEKELGIKFNLRKLKWILWKFVYSLEKFDDICKWCKMY